MGLLGIQLVQKNSSSHTIFNRHQKSLKLISEARCIFGVIFLQYFILFFFSEDGAVIKEILTRLTHHSTFPNIIVKGISIGGSDDLRDMHNQRALENIFLGAGAKLKENRSR
jgi:hypothetical protein